MQNLPQILNNIPANLADCLQKEFQKLHTKYFMGQWEPGQLNGGKFAECALRIVEHKNTGQFTPIGTQLSRNLIINSAENNTSLEPSLRFQIPRLAVLLLDFRNNRDVAHLGQVDANGMDAAQVISSANWIVAELIRLENHLPPEKAQTMIKQIIERRVPIIEEIGGSLKCLDTNLNVESRVLVFCYQKYPDPISLNEIYKWTEYSNKSMLKKILLKTHKNSLIHFAENEVYITRRGLLWVEKNIKFELDI